MIMAGFISAFENVAKKMKRLTQDGYTIIEVMIFLAISGLLFASAVVAVGGGQRQAQYSQAVRDFETQIKDVANDVSNGFYPSYERGRCSVTGSGINFDNSINGAPGTSDDCVYAGKNLMFNLGDPDKFGVGILVGVGPRIGQQPNLSLTALQPTLAYKNQGSNSIDLTTTKPIRFGAQVTKIGLVDDPTRNFSSLAFLTDYNTTSQIQESGTLSTNVYGIAGNLDASSDLEDYQDDIENMPVNAALVVNPRNGFYICLKTSDNRYARVILGIDGVITATKSEFDLVGGAECPA